MTSSKTKYSISAAARIADKSRTTIASHIKSGKLSLTTSVDGSKSIDASELIRAYADECDFDRATKASKPNSNSKPPQVNNGQQQAPTELHSVQQLLEGERKERDREREQLQARIDHLEDSLKLAQEGHNRATLLLEDRTNGVGGLGESFRTLEERISNQEEEFRKKRGEIERQANRYKMAYHAEKSKTTWEKLFG